MIKKIIFISLTIILLASCGGERKRKVQVQTSFGNMTFELYNSTPQHRDNFVKHAEAGFYDGLLFHRVMAGFMIQGGDPQSKNAVPGQRLGTGGPGYQLPPEIGAPHFKGTMAAARTPNPEKKSSGSQFYIVQGNPQTTAQLNSMGQSKGIQYNADHITKYLELGGRPDLDMEYTVFGEIIEGMDVIDKIAAVQTDASNRPLTDVKMTVVLLN